MASQSMKEFLNLLRKSQLLNDKQLNLVEALSRGGKAVDGNSVEVEPREFSLELVKQKLLTEWQRDQLLRGQTGFVLEKYRLLKPVGKGGMGHVFQAVDDRSGAIVAIKVMARKLTGNQTLVNRFRREIKASSQLNNPHIVRTLDAGRVGNVDFMVMEFVNGDQLDRVTRRIPVMPFGIACEIIRQAATGLQHAHDKKMVHRDIKPANLIVDWSEDGSGTIKIMDMGLVRLANESDEEKTVTRAGQVMGTPDYMSPEQAWDTTKADIRSDIYSLGCAFFRMLTGRIPFPGDNPLQVLMARCSKDAPGVRSLRPEIPSVIDEIVRRMTMRDPEGRYQTPHEVALAVAPFCEPLTMQSLKQAAQALDAEEENLVELEVVDETGSQFNQDDGYQQFLREMGSGAAVDMMNTSSPTPSTGVGSISRQAAATIPILDHGPATSAATLIDRRSRKQNGHTIAYAVGGGAMMLLVAIVWFLVSPRQTDRTSGTNGGASFEKDTEISSGDESVSGGDLPIVRIADPETIIVKAGELVSFVPKVTITRPATTGTLSFRLAKGSPATATIDGDTGEITWQTTMLQTPADYDIPAELVLLPSSQQAAAPNQLSLSSIDHGDKATRGASDAKATVVASFRLRVTVQPSSPTMTLPLLPALRFMAGARAQVSLAAAYSATPNAKPAYSIVKGLMPGMILDAETGAFTWIPSDNQVGRHQISVQVKDTATEQILATASYELRVAPSTFEVTLPDFPVQNATAGERFQMRLIPRLTPGRLRGIRIRPDGNPPQGVTIDMPSATLSWDVPATASGRTEIRLVAEPLLPDAEFSSDSKTETIVIINVQPASTGNTPINLPVEGDVKAAESNLREVYKRELAAARTPSARMELARIILTRCLNQESGADDFAMLNIASDLAERARAADVILEVRHLRNKRYGVSELDKIDDVFMTFSRSALSQLQQDVVIEHTVRLALLGTSVRDWHAVDTALTFAEQLLKNGSGVIRQFQDDVDSARDLASQLKIADAKQTDLSPTDRIRIDQIKEKLARWTFRPLFYESTTLSYFQSSNIANPLPDNGRPLWKIDNGTIRFEASSQNGSAGFIDIGEELSRFVVRFQIVETTNALQFVFGAGREQNLSAFLLTMDSSVPGQIQRVTGGTLIARPTGNIPVSGNGIRKAEIIVDGTHVTARIDGTTVVSTSIADLQPGRIGLMVPLLQTSTGPRLEIRDLRILKLPPSP